MMASFLVFHCLTLLVLVFNCDSQQFNLDPCYSNPCAAGAICNSMANNLNYTCQCLDGFAGDGYSNCTNVCFPNPCSNEYLTCHVNTNGHSSSEPYICTCDAPNYNSSDGTCCKQFCPSMTNGSQVSIRPPSVLPDCHSHCTYPSYTCPLGYINYQNPPSCKEFNICEPYNPCGSNGICTPKATGNSTYECQCLPGYLLNEDGRCEDEDECTTNFPCEDPSVGTVCTNTQGHYSCSCNLTISISVLGNSSNSICIALDMCYKNNSSCEQNCENSPGGPICTCVDGYVANGTSCEFDENSTYVHCDKPCSATKNIIAGTCLNDTCHCFSGYTLKDGICIPQYSCNDINDNCYFDFKCTNTSTRPGYSCHCDETKYITGPDGRCYDFNECESGENNCDGNAVCINNDGGYTCKCNLGFSGNGFNCTELPDPCEDPTVMKACAAQGESCRQRAPGIPECYCSMPYTLIGNELHGYVCVPPPDASIYIYQLSFEMAMHMTEDSYEARRQLENDLLRNFFPYVTSVPLLNIEVVECVPVTSSGVQVTMNLLFNEDMSYLGDLLMEICSDYSFLSNACVLPANVLVYNSTSTIHLVDITNASLCANPEFLCGSHSNCLSLDHDYECVCESTYAIQGYVNSRSPICVDINECADDPDICGSPVQRCVNHVGNYTCECISCFIWDDNHDDCIYVCQNNPCLNNGYCQAVMAGDICSYGCTCSENYFGPNCALLNEAVHVAKNDEAIIGGVLGGLLAIMVGLSLFLVYKIYRWKGYFSIQKRNSDLKGV